MIEAVGLTKTYRQGRGLFDRTKPMVHALSGVDLHVAEREIAALLGPNGAGKTTLIKIICSLILPDSGTVKLRGVDIYNDTKGAKRMVGLVVGEERSFYWRLTGRQNLNFFAALYNLAPRDARKKVNDVMELLNIECPDRRYQEYSTGMKQRLAIARCLLSDAKLILMDEPTRSLDPLAAGEFHGLIREKLVKEWGRTVLFTTHRLDEAEGLSDRIIIINEGRIAAAGSKEELSPLEERYRWAVSS